MAFSLDQRVVLVEGNRRRRRRVIAHPAWAGLTNRLRAHGAARGHEFMARVIFFVALTDRMRCRYSRICAPHTFPPSLRCVARRYAVWLRGSRRFLDDLLLGREAIANSAALSSASLPSMNALAQWKVKPLKESTSAVRACAWWTRRRCDFADRAGEQIAASCRKVVEELGLELTDVLHQDRVETLPVDAAR